MSDLSLVERAEILSKVYAAIQIYFAHWQTIPEYDLDAAYHEALERALLTEDHRSFSLEMMRFVAGLKNGHSWYQDPLLWKQSQPLAFHLRPHSNQWIVTSSQIPAINTGDILLQIDGRGLDDWFQEVKQYTFASSDREARHRFNGFLRLFLPERCRFQFEESGTVEIDHSQLPEEKLLLSQSSEGRWLTEGRIAYVYIPSFNAPHFEAQAIELVHQFKDAHSLIIDVRKNAGGNTPSQLVESLMERPYQFYAEQTPAIFSLFRYRSQQDTTELPEEARGYFGAFKRFANTNLNWPADINQPGNTIFKGHLIIMTSGFTGSAAEDFTIPFKNNGRATLIGETTVGSTGQPYKYDFPNGAMLLIGSKRAYYPDGSPFEGVGIRPDFEVIPSREDLRAGRDTALEYAKQYAESLT